ncbi:MAG: Autoinducer-2 kinase [Anaerolineales bacterium]|nr:Autoinducer-2 kinase [Anaerolineales bacterium]
MRTRTLSTVAPERIEAPLVLAIDIGTSSVRASVFDRQGRAVEGVEARRPHEFRTTTEGASEADPDELLGLVWQCLDDVLERAGTLAPHIAGIGACTFVTNILGVNDAGQAITSLSTYADTRSAVEVAGLRAEFDERAVHDRTGCHFHPSYLPARFRWLARTRPELLKRVARWISIGEYIELKLFGEAAVSYSVAAWTGLLDREGLAWDEPLLAALPISEENLSPLTDVHVPRQGLRAEFAERWPALRDVPWFPAVGDGATANIGSGCVSPARVALTVGSTSAMRAVVDGPVPHVPDGLWCYRVDGERSLPGGALTEGGSVFEWMTETLQVGDLAEVEPALAAMEPDAHGLTVLPFLAGERSPGWAGHARATIHGLTLATRPVEILRAGLEAVAYRIGLVFEMLRPLLPAEPEVVASGGAILSSPTWLQIMTDVLGRPVVVSAVQEASSRGAALLALEALGVLDDVEDAPDFVGAAHEPDGGRHAVYRAAMERQRDLYQKLV